MGLFVAAGVVELPPSEKPPVEGAAAPPKGLPVAATPGVVGLLAAGFCPKLKLEPVGVCVEGEGAPNGLGAAPEAGAAAFPKLKPEVVGVLFVFPNRPPPEFPSVLGAAVPNRPGEDPDDEPAGCPKLKDMAR